MKVTKAKGLNTHLAVHLDTRSGGPLLTAETHRTTGPLVDTGPLRVALDLGIALMGANFAPSGPLSLWERAGVRAVAWANIGCLSIAAPSP